MTLEAKNIPYSRKLFFSEILIAFFFLVSCIDQNTNSQIGQSIPLPDFSVYPTAELTICFDCLNKEQAIKFEESIGSKRLILDDWQVERLIYTSLHPSVGYREKMGGVITPRSSAGDYHLIFERKKSDIAGFKQLVYYYLVDDNWLKIYDLVSRIRTSFHLGEECFGYAPVVPEFLNVESLKLTPVNRIDVEEFKSAYFSIINFTKRNTSSNSIVEKANYALSDDYYADYAGIYVTRQLLAVEDNWQYDFLAHSYFNGSLRFQAAIAP